MTIFLIIAYAMAVLALGSAGFFVLQTTRDRGAIARSINMVLFSVTIPRPTSSAGGTAPKSEKDLIAVTEQLLSSFTNLHASGWNKFLYSEPYIVLEIAVKNIGQEIQYYIAVPRSYEQTFEKQLHGLYPDAELELMPDYSIFHPHGVALGVAVTLKNNPILPIRTYQHFPSDPLGEILTALSKIQQEGEGAAVQLLIRPSRREDQRSLAQTTVRHMQEGHQFHQALSRAKKPVVKEENPQQPPQPRIVTPFDEDLMKNIHAKASRPLFDVNIRLVVSGEGEPRTRQMLDDLTGTLTQFSATDMNSFSGEKFSGHALRDFLFQFSFRLFDTHRMMLLSSEEIASVYHFPTSAALARVKFVKSKSAQPPLTLPSEGIVIGSNSYRRQEISIHLDRGDRRRHFYLLGQTGTGKTTLMKNMMAQDLKAGDGLAFIDPHGTGVEEILELIPHERMKDVILFDPADVQHPLGLNMLEYDPKFPEQKTFVVNELLSIFQKLFLAETMGPMFDQYFRNAVLLLMDDSAHEIPTLVHIPRVLTDAAYRADKLTRETNPIVKQFWTLEAEKAGGDAALANMAPYITSKINGFIANEFLRPILSQPKSSINFRQIMDEKKILLVNLSKGRIGDINANLLGMLVVGKLLMAALSRADIPEDTRTDFYLYIDEFQNFTTDSIATILAEARKYRLDLIIANQFIKQLTDTIRDAVFGNVGSLVVFRVGADDADYLKNQFEPIFSPQDLINIDNFNACVKLLVHNQTAPPFNIRIAYPPAGDPNIAAGVKAVSQKTYGLTTS